MISNRTLAELGCATVVVSVLAGLCVFFATRPHTFQPDDSKATVAPFVQDSLTNGLENAGFTLARRPDVFAVRTENGQTWASTVVTLHPSPGGDGDPIRLLMKVRVEYGWHTTNDVVTTGLKKRPPTG